MTPPASSSAKGLALLALLVPLSGVAELGAHLVQTHSAIPEAAWAKAKGEATALAKPEDLVLFSPRWIEPVGHEHFGDLISLERAAFADVGRFPRAVEVRAHGEKRRELLDWKTLEVRKADGLEITLLENPRYRPVLSDFVTRLGKREAAVSLEQEGSEGSPCGFVTTGVQTGGLGFGTAVPGARFNCSGGAYAGVSIVTDLDYRPHRCIASPPPVQGALKIRFPNTVLGDVVSGHHALYVEAERHRIGAPVTISVSFGDEAIGRAIHVDGDGWKAFEFPTGPLKGRTGDLVFTIASPNGNRRAYCFEAVIQ